MKYLEIILFKPIFLRAIWKLSIFHPASKFFQQFAKLLLRFFYWFLDEESRTVTFFDIILVVRFANEKHSMLNQVVLFAFLLKFFFLHLSHGYIAIEGAYELVFGISLKVLKTWLIYRLTKGPWMLKAFYHTLGIWFCSCTFIEHLLYL